MKFLSIFLVFFIAPDNSTLISGNNHDFTSSYHQRNNILIKNFDGTRSTISVNWSSATLYNSDGTFSTIDFGKNSSTLTAIDGTILKISHNGSSSMIFNSSGTRMTVNHMQNTSSCFTENGKHTIRHTFGTLDERLHKDKIDVLIHCNWFMRKRASALSEDLNKDESQN